MSKRQGGKAKPTKGGATKTATAKRQQAVSDKTFGMKNKKGKAAQKVVQTYTAAGKTKEDKKRDLDRELKKKAKEEKAQLEAERAILFKTVEAPKPKQKVQTAPPGVDPKSVLCINFKAGYCAQGETCPFSHDFAVERKGEKRDMYSDQRDFEAMKNDTMDQWDETKLAEVVAKKTAGKPGNPTAGTCKHFLKALEEQKFGWFWECPAGDKCPYRHALPVGFTLKKQKEVKLVDRPIEDILEERRQALTGGTPVTAATFKSWQAKILKQREAEERKSKQARVQAIQSGRLRKTGKELLQESSNTFQEELEDGEDLDIMSLLKKKKEEEEAVDLLNYELVQKISAEVAESERAFDREVAALEAQGLSSADAIAKLSLRDYPTTTTTTTTMSPLVSPRDEENEDGDLEGDSEEGEGEDGEEEDGEEEVSDGGEEVLAGVDQGLFIEDVDEDLVESDDS